MESWCDMDRICYVYADLIRKDQFTIDKVPEKYRTDVESLLAQ